MKRQPHRQDLTALAGRIQERQNVAKAHFFDEFESIHASIAEHLVIIHDGCSNDESPFYCQYSREAAQNYQVQSAEAHLYPFTTASDEMTLPDVLDTIEAFEVPTRDPPQTSCEQHVVDSLDTLVQRRTKHLGTPWLGLCLDCVKTGPQGESVCRVPHGEYYLKTPETEQAARDAKTELDAILARSREAILALGIGR